MRLFRALIHSNFFVAGVLGVLTCSTYFNISNLEHRWYVIVSVILGSFTLYTFHRLYKIDFIPKAQLSDRHTWVLSNEKWLKMAMVVAVFLAMIILPNFAADSIVWLIPAAIVSIGYTVPFIPTDSKWWRLRDIPFTKPIIIAFVVTYLTYAFPVFEQSGITELVQPQVARGFLERFLFLLTVTIPFEIRDTLADKEAGLETLSTAFGLKRAKQLAMLISVAWFASIAAGLVVMMLWTPIVVYVLLELVLIYSISRISDQWNELCFTMVFEGFIIIYGLLGMLLQVLA
ncbi:MAG: hypothetical protein R2813_06710 [Flavobacteriales bacterium]